MASKLLVFHMLVALTTILAVQTEASGGSLPSIHFINAVNGKVSSIGLTIKYNGITMAPVQLKPGQDYQINVKVDDIYFVTAVLGSTRFTSFHSYEPARDRGHGALYWKGDDDQGFSISYDKTNWRLVAAWESG